MPPNHKNAVADTTLVKLESTIDAFHLQRTVSVGELMTTDVGSCRADAVLERCAQIMWERACGCVPIVDHDDRPISLITDRDICMAAYIQGKPLASISVASVMSKRLFIVNVRDSVAFAAGIMRRHCVRRLPVVDKLGILVGILSIDDIAVRGHIGPLLGQDPLAPQTIAGTVAALAHASSPES
jgi:CBS domain-containing protein